MNDHISIIARGPAILCLTLLALFPASCSRDSDTADTAGPGEYYTCSMDPQVMENKPGNCPICHMKLIKAKMNTQKAGQITLSAQQIRLADITWDTVGVRQMAKEITLTGTVIANHTYTGDISARVTGRIEKLFAKTVGDYIRKDQPLYEIYSEDMNAAQQEYIAATQSQGLSGSLQGVGAQLAEAARNKLLLYGMLPQQIEQLKKTGRVFRSVPVYASASGFASGILATEGAYVQEGQTLYRLSSLASLWIQAQAFLPYMPYMKPGTPAEFVVQAVGARPFAGSIAFIDPQSQSPARYVPVRFGITHPPPGLKPGMMANITLQTQKTNTLSVPVDAVIQTSAGASVWVRMPDGVFQNRMVQTGMQNSRWIQITDGLKEGDIVVVAGAYLLNSEYIFKRGANPMESHSNPNP